MAKIIFNDRIVNTFPETSGTRQWMISVLFNSTEQCTGGPNKWIKARTKM